MPRQAAFELQRGLLDYVAGRPML